jgi:hypothetical protein
MQKVNVGHGRAKMDKVGWGDLPCVRRSMLLYRGDVVRDAVPMSIERKK